MFRSSRRWLVLILALAVAGPAVRAQQTAPSFHDTTALPKGVMGDRIRSVIEVLNSGSPDRIKRFLNEECAREYREGAPIDEHIAATLQILRDTGGVDFYSVRTYTPERTGQTVVILKDRALGSFLRLLLSVGEA